MNRRRTYCQMNPLTGILHPRGNAPSYRYVSPDGDGFPVTYSVTHSHTDHSSLITVHSSYTFSAKERDSETGLSYFGARYYSSDLSIWLSVDPMAAKYPSLSPYVYCADNPVAIVDPNGCFGVPIHYDIIQKAMTMSGLNTKTSKLFLVKLIEGATVYADCVGVAFNWHFDNKVNYSDVQSRWNTLNNKIDKTISRIGKGNKLFGGRDVLQLGRMLHNVQDFYAHSNYAELYIEYYQGVNNGELPTYLPTYDEGINNPDFNKMLKERLRTGDFHLLDNEKIDLNPFRENADEPTSHNNMNKDKADTYAGRLAKQAAIEHTAKILRKL